MEEKVRNNTPVCSQCVITREHKNHSLLSMEEKVRNNTPVCSQCVITGEHKNHSLLSMEEKVRNNTPVCSQCVITREHKNHSLLSMEEKVRNNTPVCSQCVITREHKNHSLLSMEEKVRNNTPVCSQCVITGEHKNHSLLSMEEKNKVVYSEMEPAMQTANRVIKKLKKAEKSLSGLLPDMKGETTDVIQEINTYYTGLHGVLQAREKQLIQQVYDAFKAGVEPLYDLKQEMQDNLKQLENAVKAAHRVLSNSDEVVLNAKDILQQLQRSREIPCIVEPKQQESSERIRFEKDHKLMEEIIGHGLITGTVPSK
ncbi:unnamed protein product [Mytilus coruscus]|uniref:Uncharacterized protein n=2 Tax=Mytilus coruscus TaxID=42192 RepID=A0A6J8BLK0_MYTCO|nr:unnamed protein product [Mytilus coruscus]